MAIKLSFSNPQCVVFDDLLHLQSEFSAVRQLLNRQGYCLICLWDASEEVLTQVQQQLGEVQWHVRANQAGVVSVSPQPEPWQDKIDTDKYLGIKTLEHFPHTDGAYLYGFTLQLGRFDRIAPPAYVLLQSVKPSSSGGESIVIDGQAVLEDLLRRSPHIARVLAESGCVSFCRDDQQAFQVAVYEKLSVGRYRLRFRYDKALYVKSDTVRKALHYLHKHYLVNPQYHTKFRLESGQVLVVDNLRMLHGRTSFSAAADQQRFLRRVWVADPTLPAAPTSFVESPDTSCRAFVRMNNYARKGQPCLGSQSSLNPGIYLPGNLEAILHRQASYDVPIAC